MLTYYVSNMILKHLTGGLRNSGNSAGIVLTADCYIGLFTDIPYDLENDADRAACNLGTGFHNEVEAGANGYERQLIGKGANENNASSWFNKIGIDNTPAKAVDGKCENVDLIYFPEVLQEQGWGEISYVGLFDSKTNGKLLAYAHLKDEDGNDTTILPNKGELPIIRKKQLKLELN